MEEKYIADAKLLPNYFVFCYRKDLSTGDNVLIDMSKGELKGKWVDLTDVWVTRNANVDVWAYKDGKTRVEANTNSLLDIADANKYKIVNTKRFKLVLRAAAAVTAYESRYGMWVYEPTIADKLQEGLELTEEEVSIAEDTGLLTQFTRGLAPVPRSYWLERNIQILQEQTEAIQEDLTAANGLRYSYLSPEEDRFLVLRMIASLDPTATTTNAFITIWSDEVEVLKFPCSVMDIDTDLPLFVPARESLEIEASTDTDITNFRMRWKLLECRLTDYLAMLWGILKREDDEELWKQVKAGV